MNIKIGDTIYYREERVMYYATGVVLGETSRSWLILHVGYTAWQLKELGKYAKRLPKSMKGYTLGTKRDLDLQIWYLRHRYSVGSLLESQDAEVVLKVAKLIGYTELPKGDL